MAIVVPPIGLYCSRGFLGLVLRASVQPRIRWMRGRREEGVGVTRTLEWIGCDDAGEATARVARVQGPLHTGWRRFQAVPLAAVRAVEAALGGD